VEPPPLPNLDPQTVHLGVERTPGFGSCPVYALALAADGGVKLTADVAENTLGRRWKIPPDSVIALGREFAEAGFFSTTDILPPLPSCGNSVTDHPTIVLQVGDSSRTHYVHYYTGCLGSAPVPAESTSARLQAPQGLFGRLTHLAARIDTVTGAVWVIDSLERAGAFPLRRGA
jgi:hypothetical protein